MVVKFKKLWLVLAISVLTRRATEKSQFNTMELKAFLEINYGGHIQVKSNHDDIRSPYIVALHQFSSYFNQLKKSIDLLNTIAQKFPQILFFVGDWSEEKTISNKFKRKTLPQIIAFRNYKKFMCHKPQDVNGLSEFCMEFLNSFGFKSEPLPEKPITSWTAKVAVALNFHQLVTTNSKDVILMLYRPFNEGTDDFLKSLDKLAAILYQNDEHKHIDVVHMNIEKNSILIDIDEYYYIKQCIYIRQDDKSIAIKPFGEDLSVYSMIKFIAQNSTIPLKRYNRDGEVKNKKQKRKRKQMPFDSYKYLERFQITDSTRIAPKHCFRNSYEVSDATTTTRCNKPKSKPEYYDPIDSYDLYVMKYGNANDY